RDNRHRGWGRWVDDGVPVPPALGWRSRVVRARCYGGVVSFIAASLFYCFTHSFSHATLLLFLS
ncbi:hypothetical protein Dimus_032190, partial [Dionaea muscipula]